MAHAPICTIKKCPEKTVVRISDGEKRLDLCPHHGAVTYFMYREREEVHIVDCWNGYTKENFEAALVAAENMSEEDARKLIEENGKEE